MYIFQLDILGITLAPSYYGLMYVLWFVFGYLILKKRAVLNEKQLDDLLLYMFGWIILGGRLWYMIFYNFSNLISEPLSLIRVWEWGMSFHGWVIWVIIAMLLFAKKYKIDFFKLADEICLILPIWLWLGRIWNYINGELLWYSWYTGPFAINGQFPSPLLEALLEWVVLFGILWWFKSLPLSGTPFAKGRSVIRYSGQLASLFLIWYWVFRIFVELFFREPDAHIWYILPYISLGTLLSLPMVIVGLIFYFRLQKNNHE